MLRLSNVLGKIIPSSVRSESGHDFLHERHLTVQVPSLDGSAQVCSWLRMKYRQHSAAQALVTSLREVRR